MNQQLLLNNSLRVLWRNKMRTLFMGIGVTVGVATLIAGQALSSGAGEQIEKRVNKMFGPGTILLISGTQTYEDLQAIEDSMQQVIAISPRYSSGENEVSYQGINRQVAVFGHTEKAEFVWNRSVTEGRYFTTEDITSMSRVAMIGHNLAASLFADDDPLGREIMIGTVSFRIVGILEPQGIDPHGEDRDEDVFVPITTAMRRLNNAEYFSWTKIVVNNHETVDDDADEIAEIMRDQHHIGVGEKEDFNLYTSKFAGRMMDKANRVLNVYLMVAAALVLLVAAVVIATIMLVVVRDRVSEIGLRKAVGATANNISRQFLLETLAVTLISGTLGIGLGVAIAHLIAFHIAVPAILTIGSAGSGFVASLVVGVVAGFVPARKAASLNVIESLHH